MVRVLWFFQNKLTNFDLFYHFILEKIGPKFSRSGCGVEQIMFQLSFWPLDLSVLKKIFAVLQLKALSNTNWKWPIILVVACLVTKTNNLARKLNKKYRRPNFFIYHLLPIDRWVNESDYMSWYKDGNPKILSFILPLIFKPNIHWIMT